MLRLDMFMIECCLFTFSSFNVLFLFRRSIMTVLLSWWSCW